MSRPPSPPPRTLVKWGGSLITDKGQPGRDRPRVLARLAREVAAALGERPELAGRVVLGHGSGSFGHVAAWQHRVHEGLDDDAEITRERLLGVALTQRRAAELHRRVLDALAEAGVATFSVSPSSALVTAAGSPGSFAVEPVIRALALGLIPVVYGDVVMDREQGFAICSTEGVFDALVAAEALAVERILWLGETAGVWDEHGETIPRITPATWEDVRQAVGGSAGTDVTGGMLHRVESAVELARRGVVSFIGDGRRPGLLTRLLTADEAFQPGREQEGGTWVAAAF